MRARQKILDAPTTTTISAKVNQVNEQHTMNGKSEKTKWKASLLSLNQSFIRGHVCGRTEQPLDTEIPVRKRFCTYFSTDPR